MANEKSQNVQDVFLNHVRKSKTPDYAAAELTLGFNSRYLLDVAARMKGATLLAELDGDEKAPVLIRDPDCDRQLFVLMPMRA